MAKIIVFHYKKDCQVPELSAAQIAEVKAAYGKELENHPDVKMVGVFIDENGKGFCEWDAPNVEIVKQIVFNVTGEYPGEEPVVVENLFG